MTSEIKRKHVQEREAVVDTALRDSYKHLIRAGNHFGAVIQDQGLQDEFADGIGQAQKVLVELGVVF